MIYLLTFCVAVNGGTESSQINKRSSIVFRRLTKVLIGFGT